jgi:hypothetical protein
MTPWTEKVPILGVTKGGRVGYFLLFQPELIGAHHEPKL